ncbi:hypothetical protein J437_LFUL003831 [Ladona fulva]|uniref:Strictosidine synthase conserved region domain-containing protein n=1 Tax=Ladona fulva TaxID=123851 RepID=A0A8K0KHF8_LADFU|nr:hypothetical protein J437_LFUL003831 [Ladona fulva]
MAGKLRSVFRHIVEAVIVFLLIVYIPALPPDLEFSQVRYKAPMALEGPLAPNRVLDKGEHLFEGKIKGPESIAIFGGEIYTGIHGGEIIKISNDKYEPVVKLGKTCDGVVEEEKCGRPLGLRFDSKGDLFVADAYYGLFKVDVKKRAFTQLVSMDEPISGKKPKFPNSIDIAKDGKVYWTDSSTEVDLQNGVFALLGDRSGRLIKYDPVSKTNEVLLDKIRFANGVCLSPDEDYVLVSETMGYRILRYYLKGPKAGRSDVFLDGLPGVPDNIKPNGEGGFLITLITQRDKGQFDLVAFLGKYPIIQKFFARMLMLIEMTFSSVEMIMPNAYTKKAVHWIGNFESIQFMIPSGARALDVDSKGKIIGSLHCSDGSLTSISEVVFHDRTYYLGSPYNTYLGRVKTRIPIHIKMADLPGGVEKS